MCVLLSSLIEKIPFTKCCPQSCCKDETKYLDESEISELSYDAQEDKVSEMQELEEQEERRSKLASQV